MRVRLPKVKKVKFPRKFSTMKIIRKMRKGYLYSAKEEREKKIEAGAVYIHPGKEIIPFGAPTTAAGIPTTAEAPEMPTVKPEVVGAKFEVPAIETVILKTPMPLVSPLSTEEKEMLSNIRISYPLIPSHPKKNERVFAYSRIAWDERLGSLVYTLVEPKLTQEDIKLIEEIKTELEERLDIDFSKLGEIKAEELLKEEIVRIISTIRETTPPNFDILQYYIERDIIGLGKIEPLMKDPDIEDISCDGVGIPLYIYHRNPILGSLITNTLFENQDELDTFVMRLSQKCGKSISVAEPLVEGALPDGSRVQATLGTDIARRGSNFTIRKFTAKPLTPVHMLNFGTLDSTQLAYLWLAVENRKSVLISGGTATGKTSLLNALSLFIRPSMKIVSIEDTPELRLPHPHWIPEVARTPMGMGKKTGEVSLFDLLKSSLRQRPDYIIVGEVRGREAFVMFQQIATGHAAMATIHAASLPQLVDRLTTPPISLPPTLLENIDIIIFLALSKMRDKYLRRANEILEVKGIQKERPVTSKVFGWNSATDTFESVEKSGVLGHIAKSLNMTEDSLKEELRVRKNILEWMKERGIFDYTEVAMIINGYYYNPERIINLIEET